MQSQPSSQREPCEYACKLKPQASRTEGGFGKGAIVLFEIFLFVAKIKKNDATPFSFGGGEGGLAAETG